MRAVHIVKYGKFPILKEIPAPTLQDGAVLIRMKYAPVNPSDLFFYMGKYGVIKQGFPIVGFEGSGIVEDAKDKKLIGKKVSVTANKNNGTHATHIRSHLDQVIFWPDNADLQKISMAFVNPLSCIGLCNIVKQQKPKNVFVSAGASQIGKMIISSLHKNNPSLGIYAINRTLNKSQSLKDLGAREVILIDDQLSEKIKRLEGKSVFFDCVGGNFAGKVFNDLQNQSQMVCYGRQSGQDLGGINLGGLYYGNKTIRGFWLNNWLKSAKRQQIQKAKAEVVQKMEQLYSSTVRQVFKIENFMDAYRASTMDKSQGKILLDLS